MIVLETKDLQFAGFIEYPEIRVEEGKVVFLRGKSGAGKSSLLGLFNGTMTPSRGHIAYRGQPLKGLDPIQLRRNVLLAGQDAFLFPGTILDNFRSYYAFREQAPPSEEHMEMALATCQAGFPLDTDTETLSGGEKQRVFIAICLSFEPDVLMLDEPTSALDADTAAQFFQALLAHCKQRGTTVLVVSHDEALSRRFADQVVDISSNRFAQEEAVAHA